VGYAASTHVNVAEASGKSMKSRTENALEGKLIGLDVNSAVWKLLDGNDRVFCDHGMQMSETFGVYGTNRQWKSAGA
jgi:hypothetical protein